jgi:hypothetical protein
VKEALKVGVRVNVGVLDGGGIGVVGSEVEISVSVSV